MGVTIIIVLFQINFYMFLGKNGMTRNVPAGAIWKIIFLEVPGNLTLTLPIAVALATSMVVSRITRESELTALRSVGTPIFRAIVPVAFFGMVVGLANFFIADRVAPITSKKSLELQTSVGVIAGAAQLAVDRPIKIKNYTVSLGQARQISPDTLEIKEILLFERPEPDVAVVILSPYGTYEQGIWRFRDASVMTTRFGVGKTGWVEQRSKELVINQKIAVADLFLPPSGKELSIAPLKQKIDELKAAGQDVRSLEIEYHNKFGVPAMCFIFAVVCPVFSIMFARHGGFAGVVVSMVVVMLYFNAWVIATEILGKQRGIPPIWAVWGPNIIFLALGIAAIRRLE
jgi:lipopolysaccharide export system permease protein